MIFTAIFITNSSKNTTQFSNDNHHSNTSVAIVLGNFKTLSMRKSNHVLRISLSQFHFLNFTFTFNFTEHALVIDGDVGFNFFPTTFIVSAKEKYISIGLFVIHRYTCTYSFFTIDTSIGKSIGTVCI